MERRKNRLGASAYDAAKGPQREHGVDFADALHNITMLNTCRNFMRTQANTDLLGDGGRVGEARQHKEGEVVGDDAANKAMGREKDEPAENLGKSKATAEIELESAAGSQPMLTHPMTPGKTKHPMAEEYSMNCDCILGQQEHELVSHNDDSQQYADVLTMKMESCRSSGLRKKGPPRQRPIADKSGDAYRMARNT
jgi:hypothetical protein